METMRYSDAYLAINTLRTNIMGLDNYFMIKKYEKPVFNIDINLCGGMMSGNGEDGSFRGKVYNDFITFVTFSKHSLYNEEMNHDDILEISNALTAFDYDEWIHRPEGKEYEVTKQEFHDLRELFKEAAKDENIVLLGWW